MLAMIVVDIIVVVICVSGAVDGSQTLLLLLLQQAMDFEPIRATAVARTTFRHAYHQAFAQTACLARCAILFVYDAFAIILAFGY